MKILALDLATITGWACSDGSSGVWEYVCRRGDSPGVRFIQFQGWLRGLVSEREPTLIVYEQAAVPRSNAAMHVAHGLIAATEMVAEEIGADITSRSPSSVKKHALPNIPQKRRNKAKMIQAAENKWPDVEFVDDNHADAVWLLDFVCTELGIACA